MNIAPHQISLSTKTCSPINRESPTDYVSTIRTDILYGEKREVIGQATVYRVRMDQFLNDDAWSLFDIFDGHSRGEPAGSGLTFGHLCQGMVSGRASKMPS